MQPLIIAMGRSDNHALVSRHARALGVDYIGLEAFEAADLTQDIPALRRELTSIANFRPVILAAIDSTISASLLRTFTQLLETEIGTAISLRTDPKFLQSASTQSSGLDRDHLFAVSMARSPHGQISIWPVIRISRDGVAQPIIDETSFTHDEPSAIEMLHEITTSMIDLLSREGLVGLMTYVVDPIEMKVVRQEFGVASITFWSESACYTSATEQLVRAILDLPLGDARLIDFEELFMSEEFELPDGVISDPIRPFLHLFARNPRLKVSYLVKDFRRCVISLFASNENEGLSEMAHARDFMFGIDD